MIFQNLTKFDDFAYLARKLLKKIFFFILLYFLDPKNFDKIIFQILTKFDDFSKFDDFAYLSKFQLFTLFRPEKFWQK